MTYPSGREVSYNRDIKGRVASVETVALGNNLSVTNQRGLDWRLKRHTLVNASTATAPSDLSYLYDPDGNVTSIDDAVTPERSEICVYDPMGRLNMTVAEGSALTTSYAYTSGTTSVGTRTIQYDSRGNPTSETSPGDQTVTLAYDATAG